MLILLQPGIQPLGQFDIHDSHISNVAGGEVGYFAPLDLADTYSADAFSPGPRVQIKLGPPAPSPFHSVGLSSSVTVESSIWGLVDEGSTGGPDTPPLTPGNPYGSGGRGYGTSFGKAVGATVGQGTGFGELGTSGAVVIGPSTIRGSGKVTLWTKPGLYGVTADAFLYSSKIGGSYFDMAANTLNLKLSGFDSDDGFEKLGKLYPPMEESTPFTDRTHVAYSVGGAYDGSFVSTPPYYANTSKKFFDFCVIYMVGCV